MARPVHKSSALLMPIFTFSILVASQPAAQASPPTFTRFKLNNGIRVVLLHVENSEHFAVFSYLPLGLASDGAGRTQWSHLIEHLTLRTTGPITDHAERTPEPMSDFTHLDFLGTTANWREGLDLQAKWLSGPAFSESSLREEIPKVLSEVAGTVDSLHTHKLAVAAWNQVFRHGRTEVAVLGGLRNAKLSDAQSYRDKHFMLADRVALCAISGLPASTLKPEFESRLGTIRSSAKALPSAGKQVAVGGELLATWDLDARHYMVFFPIPEIDHEDYATLYVAAAFLNSRFINDPEIKELAGAVVCSVDLTSPEGSFLYVSASLKPDIALEEIKHRIAFQVSKLSDERTLAQIPIFATLLSDQLRGPADLTRVFEMKPPEISEAFVLGKLALQWGMFEFRFGDRQAALAEAIKTVTEAGVAAAAKKYLSDQKRTTLVLEPDK